MPLKPVVVVIPLSLELDRLKGFFRLFREIPLTNYSFITYSNNLGIKILKESVEYPVPYYAGRGLLHPESIPGSAANLLQTVTA